MIDQFIASDLMAYCRNPLWGAFGEMLLLLFYL